MVICILTMYCVASSSRLSNPPAILVEVKFRPRSLGRCWEMKLEVQNLHHRPLFDLADRRADNACHICFLDGTCKRRASKGLWPLQRLPSIRLPDASPGALILLLSIFLPFPMSLFLLKEAHNHLNAIFIFPTQQRGVSKLLSFIFQSPK